MYSFNDYGNIEALFVGLAGVLIVLFVIILAFFIVYLVGLAKVFKKAGREGWAAIIPFYNTWVLVEIAGNAWWYALIIIIANLFSFNGDLAVIVGIVALVASFFVNYNLSKKFHRDVGTAILLTVFPFIMIPIMGFSSSFQYDSSVQVSENGPISNSNTSGNNTYKADFSSNDATDKNQFCKNCGNQLNSDAKFCGRCGCKVDE